MIESRAAEMICVASLSELQAKRVIVIAGRDRPIAVFWHDGQAHAVDNRCPHLGFPLHQGSVRDGLLTCHWHEARFDLCTGCTFDLWADDVPAFDTAIHDGTVYVAPMPRHIPNRADYLRRLTQGLEQEVSLVEAKSILGLRRTGAQWAEILREIARFGARNHDRWGEGLTLLAIAGNLLPQLSPESAYLVVYRASRQVGIDCSDAPARRQREPLAKGEHATSQLGRWMRTWVRARHRDAAERTLLTALDQFGLAPDVAKNGRLVQHAGNISQERLEHSSELADFVFTAASERVYAQIGHVFDGWNKAFELLNFIGWSHAGEILPLAVPATVAARGAEEDAHWHHPHELIEPLRAVEAELPEILDAARGRPSSAVADLSPVLLGDDPLEIIGLVKNCLTEGVPPAELARQVAYAAAVRLARFSKNNEVADWFNPRHTFIFANAVHQAVKRCPTAGSVRGIFHTALSVYMDRFLNVPPARLPDDSQLTSLPTSKDELCRRLILSLDLQSNLDDATAAVLRYLRLGHPFVELVDILALAIAREDLDFHAMQVLEAGVQQCREWSGGRETEQIMVAVVRQLAAFCPTPRAAHHIATTALRLDRGDKMYEES